MTNEHSSKCLLFAFLCTLFSVKNMPAGEEKSDVYLEVRVQYYYNLFYAIIFTVNWKSIHRCSTSKMTMSEFPKLIIIKAANFNQSPFYAFTWFKGAMSVCVVLFGPICVKFCHVMVSILRYSCTLSHKGWSNNSDGFQNPYTAYVMLPMVTMTDTNEKHLPTM